VMSSAASKVSKGGKAGKGDKVSKVDKVSKGDKGKSPDKSPDKVVDYDTADKQVKTKVCACCRGKFEVRGHTSPTCPVTIQVKVMLTDICKMLSDADHNVKTELTVKMEAYLRDALLKSELFITK